MTPTHRLTGRELARHELAEEPTALPAPADVPVAREPGDAPPDERADTARPKFQHRAWLHLTLLLLTVGTTTLAGASHYAGFLSDFLPNAVIPLSPFGLLASGFWYSGTILAILGAHELGHYYACRYYRVDASLPYFLPAPFVLTGTLGAVIRIREPIPTKRMLFDIGIAGPIAGFVLAVPALLVGLGLSRVVPLPTDFVGLELGEPMLFRAASWMLWGSPPEGYTVNMHPMAFAAWFGLIATALNLFPVGQLDGGHISYAVLGRRSSQVSLAFMALAIGLTFVSLSWLLPAAVMIVFTLAMGLHHPRIADEHVPLDRTRLWLAAGAAAMFAVCFTPAPIRLLDLVRR